MRIEITAEAIRKISSDMLRKNIYVLVEYTSILKMTKVSSRVMITEKTNVIRKRFFK